MKKSLIIICFVFICLIPIIHKNRIETKNKKFYVYIKEGDNYVKQSTSSFPISGYALNTTESSCTGGGVLSQDLSTGKIKVSISGTDKCNLYFDPTARKVITDLVGNAPTNSTNVITATAPSGATCTNTLAYDGTTDNNLRYVGTNPCNYVSFNSENDGAGAWRIIGIMNNIDDGTGNTETRIKLVRATTIGTYSWDSSDGTINSGNGVNDWSYADLKNELNGDYLDLTLTANPTNWYNGQSNAQTGEFDINKRLGATAQGMIGNAKWNLGGGSYGTNNANLITSTSYVKERDTVTWSTSHTCEDGACPRTTEWVGKVALPYPSDYGYATAGGTTTTRANCIGTVTLYSWNSSDYTDCKNNDWLKSPSGYYWLLTPYNGVADEALETYSGGFVRTTKLYNAYNVRPTVYLKSNIAITGGNGTTTSPYTLG